MDDSAATERASVRKRKRKDREAKEEEIIEQKSLEQNKLKVKSFYGGRFYFKILPINLMKPNKIIRFFLKKAKKQEKGTKQVPTI